MQSDGWFYIYIIAQPSENCNSVLVTVIIFRQIARSFSCFLCPVAAHCTEENIVHLVDLLLSDRFGNIIRVRNSHLDTLIRHIVNRLLSFLYGRCCIQILVLSDSFIFLAVCHFGFGYQHHRIFQLMLYRVSIAVPVIDISLADGKLNVKRSAA